jgi:hypothetical protein
MEVINQFHAPVVLPPDKEPLSRDRHWNLEALKKKEICYPYRESSSDIRIFWVVTKTTSKSLLS